jgi:hypothetical protein
MDASARFPLGKFLVRTGIAVVVAFGRSDCGAR